MERTCYQTSSIAVSRQLSIQSTVAEIEGKTKPPEVIFVVRGQDNQGGTVLNLTKQQAKEIYNEHGRLIKMLE